jgi:hypothetical protein
MFFSLMRIIPATKECTKQTQGKKRSKEKTPCSLSHERAQRPSAILNFLYPKHIHSSVPHYPSHQGYPGSVLLSGQKI